jgi:methylase of polypeptide subunit release factors
VTGPEITAPTETIDFGGLQIAFDDRVLRPREWTTAQSWWAASLLPALAEGDVLELCSGAGQIGLLAIAGSTRRLVCVDVSPVAAAYTLGNAEAAALGDRVSVREGMIADVLEPFERFPMIIADPPWVPHSETARFPEDPLLAIDGGDDGLYVVRDCVQAMIDHLAPGGVALLQVGTSDQVAAVATLLEGSGLVTGEVREYGDRGVLLRIDCPA